MKLIIKKVKTVPEFIDHIRLRVDVFIKEIGFTPGWEPDEDDKEAVHLSAYLKGKVVGTIRYRKVGRRIFKLERMAVQKGMRNHGIGEKLLSYAIKDIQKHSPKQIWMRAYANEQKFYLKRGFKPVSKPHMAFGFKHVNLEFKE